MSSSKSLLGFFSGNQHRCRTTESPHKELCILPSSFLVSCLARTAVGWTVPASFLRLFPIKQSSTRRLRATSNPSIAYLTYLPYPTYPCCSFLALCCVLRPCCYSLGQWQFSPADHIVLLNTTGSRSYTHYLTHLVPPCNGIWTLSWTIGAGQTIA